MRKVRLRPLTEEDAAALAEAAAESEAELKRRFGWRPGQGVEEEPGSTFVVTEARSGRLVGVAGIFEADGSEDGKARVSLWIRAQCRGRGYAAEACALLVERSFRLLGLRRLYARIDPANRAARRVLKKSGFQYEGCLRGDKRLNGRWVDQECWGRLKVSRRKRP